ncbi:hypothetical protein K439DRAFT_1661237 [Ramaria rubella]|nr:hypothetical protein K439DRAFT_1661237 [Ramaria rubella]
MLSTELTAYFGDVYNYCEYSGITLLFYDYIATLPREISLIWRWPWPRSSDLFHNRSESLWDFRLSINKSSLLYVLMRYPLLVAWIMLPILGLHPNVDRCTSLSQFAQAMDILSQTTVAVILLLRTYALWNQNPLVLILLGIVGLSIPGIGIWSIVLTNCVYTFDASVQSQLKLITMLFSLLTVIFDTLVVILTVYRYFQLQRVMKMSEGTLLRLIIQNGLVHYAVLFVAHMSGVIIFWVTNHSPFTSQRWLIIENRALQLSVNIISHFMLDLREMTQEATETTMAQTLSFVAFHDAELIVLMGGPTEQGVECITRDDGTREGIGKKSEGRF